MPEVPVIQLESVSKAYRIWRDPSARLKFPFLKAATSWLPDSMRPKSTRIAMGDAEGALANPYFHDFYALRDVTFAVRRGEAVGIIGRNGSGKSTLLQTIAGTLNPTSGAVQVSGRVAALLELGSGFNPDFTGRENVFLNGAVLGLSRERIAEQFDSIAAFADIGEFIDQPTKTYSSGMHVRLAFAVAAHVEPEILIVDEALSVGDARFQLKCARAIDQIVERGVTFLFVSHDLNSVKRLCSHAILLEQGRVVYQGKPNDVANLYSKLIADGGSVAALQPDLAVLRARDATARAAASSHSEAIQIVHSGSSGAEPRATNPRQKDSASQPELDALLSRVKALEAQLDAAPDHPNWRKKIEALLHSDSNTSVVQTKGSEYAYGGDLGRILEFSMVDADGIARPWFSTGETIHVLLRIESLSPLPEPIFAMTIKDRKGQDVYGTNTLFSRQPAPPLNAGDRRTVRFAFSANLMPGEYFLSLGFTHFVGEELVVVHRRYDVAQFSIHGPDRCFGIANCFARITVEPTQPSA